MELAKVTSKGQVTIPIEIRKKLGIKNGDKVLFMEDSGRIYMMNSSMDALREAQRAFAGEAEKAGLKNDDDVMAMIKELREESVVKQMRIMLDTNVLILALLFLGSKMDAMMNCIFTQHQLVLSSYVVDELKRVVRKKFPNKEPAINKLLMMMSFEYVYTPNDMESGLFDIRDGKDYPVLYTAIIEDVDILVTGDKDFSDIDVERPEIMTPAEFMERFIQSDGNVVL